MNTIRMEEMNWVDIKAIIGNGFNTVIIGIGSTEQHGPHLPTQTDTSIADYLSNEVARKLGNTLQAQTVRVGCSEHHLSFPGTISLEKSTLKAILEDYISSLSKSGFQNILLLPTHGGNFSSVLEAVEVSKAKFPKLNIIGYADLPGFINMQKEIGLKLNISAEEAGAHAGEAETSEMLVISEQLVKTDRFTPGYVGKIEKEEIDLLFKEGMEALTKNGVIGDPTKSTLENGKIYLKEMREHFLEYFRKLI